MRSCAVLSVAFVTTAVIVAPAVIAVPTPFRDITNPFGGVPGDEPVDKRSWPPSYGIGPVLIPGFCSDSGACKRNLETGIATAINDTVQQGLLTHDEAHDLLQLFQLLTSAEGIQFLKGLETEITPLLRNSADTKTASHSARSSKTAWAGAAFNGVGSFSNLANVISSNLHYYTGYKREVDSMSSAANLPNDLYVGIKSMPGETLKRGLPDNFGDLVARKSVSDWAISLLSGLSGFLSLDEMGKRELPEGSDILRRTWPDDLAQQMDQTTVTGELKRAVDLD